MYRYRGDILHLWIHVGRQGNAILRQHTFQALHGKRSLRRLVTRPIETNNQSITHQLVVAHALDRGNVLDSFCPGAAEKTA